MKILLVTHIYPPAIDGGSRVIYKLGEYFERQKHTLLVLTSNCHSTDDFANSDTTKSKLSSNQNILRLPVYRFTHRPFKIIGQKLHLDSFAVFSKGPFFKFIPFVSAVYTIIRFKPDLIVAGPLPTTSVIYARFIKLLLWLTGTNSKLLINASFHSSDKDFFKRPLIRSLKSADYLWTLTDNESQYFITHFNISPQKIINLGNGVDQSLLSKKKRSSSINSLLFIGSFAAHKGVETLIDAFIKLCDKNPNLTLTLAGQPTLFYPTLKAKIYRLPSKLKSKINFILNFTDHDLPQLIDSSSVLISPSTQESFGLVLIEAWARHCPVIAADIPASSELVNKTHGGLLFESQNSDSLVRAISSLIDQPEQAIVFGQNGFEYVHSHYTWDKIGNTICTKIFSS